jgi:hypothetical protein
MSQSQAKGTRRAVRLVVENVARDAMTDVQADILALRAVIYRGFWGRVKWLLTGK